MYPLCFLKRPHAIEIAAAITRLVAVAANRLQQVIK
jgi:hypothetical protein